jgi:hypothetical protein
MPLLSQRLLSLAMDYSTGSKKDELDEIKDKLDACELCNDKTTAAAFGYLLAMEELKEEISTSEKEEEPTIYDAISALMEQVDDGAIDTENATELCFGLIYKWLDKVLKEEGYDAHSSELFGTRFYLASAFNPFVKPGVISPPIKQ